jgi:hypothetical protein
MERKPPPTAGRLADDALKAIVAALPPNAAPERLILLPRLLREWGNRDLLDHLRRESSAMFRARQKRRQAVARCAKNLYEAISNLDDTDVFGLALDIAVRKTGSTVLQVDQSEITTAQERLTWAERWLPELADAYGPSQRQAGTRGRPRNIVSYLVMLDLEAIFEFVYDTSAERRVHREDHPEYGKEYGPFWDFVQPIWTLVFGSNARLSAAMKAWSLARNEFGETSPIIANIALRHPEWRIFEK